MACPSRPRTRARVSAIVLSLSLTLAFLSGLEPAGMVAPALAQDVDFAADDFYATGRNETLVVEAPGVLKNDTPATAVVAIRAAELPTLGNVEMDENDPSGGFTYTPNPGVTGTDQFTYEARTFVDGEQVDGFGIVTIYVGFSTAVDAVDDFYATPPGVNIIEPAPGVLANDVSEIPITEVAITAGTGNLTLDATGGFEFVAPSQGGGFTQFTYRITNAVGVSDTATIKIAVPGDFSAVNDVYFVNVNTPYVLAPRGVNLNDIGQVFIANVTLDSPPNHGTVVLQSDGGFTYTPDSGFTGVDSFDYSAHDVIGRTRTATVGLRVGNPAPVARLSRTRTTVNTRITYTLTNFSPKELITINWVRADGTTIPVGTTTTDQAGGATGTFKVPATVGGAGQKVRFSDARIGGLEVSFEIIPRIKVLTDPAQRGQTVNVSLRGYAKGETVRIRWKNGNRFVQLATVKTSSTGSANVNIVVPRFAPDGENTVRGDGTVFRSETKAVTISGGPTAAEVVEPTATPTPTPTSTPAETATPTIELSATPSPAPEPTNEPTPAPTAEPTVEPTTGPPAEVTPVATPEPSPPAEATQGAPPEISPEPTLEGSPTSGI